MFKYEKQNYEVCDEEDEFYYEIMFGKVFGIFSPFEVDNNVDFPRKDELGGIILKFLGGGAGYFKVQHEMPCDDELDAIHEICKFLKNEFGDYVVAYIICEPHIEIRDIDVPGDGDIDVTFISSRKNDGDEVLDGLIRKF